MLFRPLQFFKKLKSKFRDIVSFSFMIEDKINPFFLLLLTILYKKVTYLALRN